MPNKFKYNKTGTEIDSIFKGNWAIDTSPRNSGGGPSSTTGLYHGAEIPNGGYTIYSPGSVYTATSDNDLLGKVKDLGGDWSSVSAALTWAANNPSVLVALSDFENIVTDGLSFGFDEKYLNTYKYAPNRAYGFSTNQQNTGLSTGIGLKSYIVDTSRYNQVDNITIQILLEKTGTGTGYANHPVSKWNANGTSTASFVLYHFENYLNNGADGRVGFYANTQNGGWTSLTNQYTMSVGEKILITLAYGGGDTHYWINDNIFGIIGTKGRLSPTVATGSGLDRVAEFSGPHGHGTSKVHKLIIYDRRLTDAEILHNYQNIQNRL